MVVSLNPILMYMMPWLMVLFRISGIFVIAPVFGSKTIPARIKVFMALGLSFCVFPLLLDGDGMPSSAIHASIMANNLPLWLIVGAIAMELLVGIVIGYGASLPVLGMQVGGRVCDQQMGMSIGGVFNPEINEDSGVVSEIFFVVALSVFLIIGGHRAILTAVVGSFNVIPLGGFKPDGHVLELIIGLVSSMFTLAFRVAAPLLCIMFLQMVAMGFIARTVPQLNILSIGFPLRILLGATMLIGSCTMIIIAYSDAVTQAMQNIGRFFGL